MDEKLPIVDNDFVVQCISEYDAVFQHGSQGEVDDARLRQVPQERIPECIRLQTWYLCDAIMPCMSPPYLRMVWALVHSDGNTKYATRGRDLAQESLRRGGQQDREKDYRYLSAGLRVNTSNCYGVPWHYVCAVFMSNGYIKHALLITQWLHSS